MVAIFQQMVRILTVSGLTQKSGEFYEEVRSIWAEDYRINDGLGPITEIAQLNWQIDSEYQSFQDLFDSREFDEIVVIIADQICQYLNSNEPILIISYSAGSMIVETALSIIDQSLLKPNVAHIMLAPAINGSSLA